MSQHGYFGLRLALVSLVVLGSSTSAESQRPAMIEFFAFGKMQKGLKLVEAAHETVVLGRDGWMHSLDPHKPETRIRAVDDRFEPVSVTELRNELRAEFGHGFEVLATKNFLVVQPKGRGDRWPRLFETSHRAFVDYMSRRSVRIRRGRFPMVAVVLPDETSMYAEFKKLDIDMKRVAGIYSSESNRVITHDGGRSDSIATTVRHEAAHQSAYNIGVHSRLNDTPRWISEGIGQMFEPSGMTDSRTASRLTDRVNHDSTKYIERTYSGRNDAQFSQTVMQLISDDTMFANKTQVEEAYAVAWSMMFYLAEREPTVFAELLNHTSSQPPFREYPRSKRVADFEQIVGADTFEFSKRVSWFLQTL